ncbi:MAG: hypothetical protein ABSG01_09070 [Anaerolineales bacterium]|jgi:hypothetical protein
MNDLKLTKLQIRMRMIDQGIARRTFRGWMVNGKRVSAKEHKLLRLAKREMQFTEVQS